MWYALEMGINSQRKRDKVLEQRQDQAQNGLPGDTGVKMKFSLGRTRQLLRATREGTCGRASTLIYGANDCHCLLPASITKPTDTLTCRARAREGTPASVRATRPPGVVIVEKPSRSHASGSRSWWMGSNTARLSDAHPKGIVSGHGFIVALRGRSS